MNNFVLKQKHIYVLTDSVNKRIDNFLFYIFNKIPKSIIYRLIRKGKIRINKKRIKFKYKLKYKDIIKIPKFLEFNYLNKKKIYKNINFKMNILYEDNYLFIINKPSGEIVHAGNGINYGIIEKIRNFFYYSSFFELVHRLDKETSGLLLIAKKKNILKKLHYQIRNFKIIKKYIALVLGKFNEKKKIVKAPLIKKFFNKNKKVFINKNGKKSKTYFKKIKNFKNSSLIEIKPITGRTHQIRVHSKFLGHPIAGDYQYGDKKFNNNLKKNGLKRLFLHAYYLSFFHPITNKLIKIKAPLEKSLISFLKYL